MVNRKYMEDMFCIIGPREYLRMVYISSILHFIVGTGNIKNNIWVINIICLYLLSTGPLFIAGDIRTG